MRDFVSSLGEAIRARRKLLGLTQLRLAESADVSVELVSRIERARCAPSLATLLRFCEALETTPNHLLGFGAPDADPQAETMLDAFRVLPKPKQRELTYIAEALVRYGNDNTD